MTKIISALTGLLTLTIAAIGFILSYNALYSVAIDNSVPPGLAYLWPLLIDFALIVFSVSVLNSKLRGNTQKGGWALVIFFTVLTLFFNAVHAGTDNLITLIVAFVPPIAMFLSFERFMFQMGDNLRINTIAPDVKPVQVAKVNTPAPDVKPVKSASVNTVKPVLTPTQREIVNSVKRGNNSRVNIADDPDVNVKSRQTVGKHVKQLVNAGVLSENGNGLQVTK